MRGKTFTVVGSTGGPTYSPAWIVDNFNNPTTIGIGVIVSGNNTIADVQHTFADWSTINLNVVSAAPWKLNATLTSATQASNSDGFADTNYAYPPVAIRLRVRALTSAGVGERATITIVQAGPED